MLQETEKQKVTCQIAVRQEGESDGSSSQIDQKNHRAKSKQSRVQSKQKCVLYACKSDSNSKKMPSLINREFSNSCFYDFLSLKFRKVSQVYS